MKKIESLSNDAPVKINDSDNVPIQNFLTCIVALAETTSGTRDENGMKVLSSSWTAYKFNNSLFTLLKSEEICENSVGVLKRNNFTESEEAQGIVRLTLASLFVALPDFIPSPTAKLREQINIGVTAVVTDALSVGVKGKDRVQAVNLVCAALAKKSSVYLDLIISVLDRVFEYVKRGVYSFIDAGVGLIASIGGASTEVSVKRKYLLHLLVL